MRLIPKSKLVKKIQSKSNENGWKCKTFRMKDENLSEVSEQHQRVMRVISKRIVCFFFLGIQYKSVSDTLAAPRDCVSSITLFDVNENETWKINHNAIQWPEELTCVTVCHCFDGFNIHELIKFQVFASRYEVLQCQQLYCCERIMDYIHFIPIPFLCFSVSLWISVSQSHISVSLVRTVSFSLAVYAVKCKKNAIEMEMNSK